QWFGVSTTLRRLKNENLVLDRIFRLRGSSQGYPLLLNPVAPTHGWCSGVRFLPPSADYFQSSVNGQLHHLYEPSAKSKFLLLQLIVGSTQFHLNKVGLHPFSFDSYCDWR